mmetsp:Transcript_18732/g.46524  ORF Transcript_18732/g.46524 Transcript_18732/m.46524 type:complete len:202 (+) Transcript_18732:1697-2302(+)
MRFSARGHVGGTVSKRNAIEFFKVLAKVLLFFAQIVIRRGSSLYYSKRTRSINLISRSTIFFWPQRFSIISSSVSRSSSMSCGRDSRWSPSSIRVRMVSVLLSDSFKRSKSCFDFVHEISSSHLPWRSLTGQQTDGWFVALEYSLVEETDFVVGRIPQCCSASLTKFQGIGYGSPYLDGRYSIPRVLHSVCCSAVEVAYKS